MNAVLSDEYEIYKNKKLKNILLKNYNYLSDKNSKINCIPLLIESFFVISGLYSSKDSHSLLT